MKKKTNIDERRPLRRRDLLKTVGLGVIAMTTGCLASKEARATPEMVAKALRELISDRATQEGLITIALADVAEDGNTVPISIDVDSPMTKDDYVKAIHIFVEGNPQPRAGSFHLTPRSGKASISTRIRLGETQDVLVIALMSDGSVFRETKHVKVTISGCGS
jgi:sulfur-oxidizing protein SoxY